MGKKFSIQPPYYPIVYVRGYAMRSAEREETFHDTYYGFSATSVEKRQAPPPTYFEADMFEGQLVRLMKLGDYSYADSVNRGLEEFHDNPSRSVWVCRFYDQDYFRGKIRTIEEHGEDLRKLICEEIPSRLRSLKVGLGQNDKDYRVILIAHSMGGLVCRTLIQKILPESKKDPKRWIHRLVTLGTPHGGIDLGRIPNFLENFLVENLNPFDANIFKQETMREYLNLGDKETSPYDVHSLGPDKGPHHFPVKRCLCIIGSDYSAYGAVKRLTGDYSDGLVKQNCAYLVGGNKPAEGGYPDSQVAFWANIHRAHSGYRGIVNSYESFENIHRFLFGDTLAQVGLQDLKILTSKEKKSKYFYDFEVLVAIRGTSIYLHRREQDPCENAMRFDREAIPKRLILHTGFLNSSLISDDSGFSHFAITVRIIERRVKDKLLWDHEYPAKPIYTETFEVRVGIFSADDPAPRVQYRSMSSDQGWQEVAANPDGDLIVPLNASQVAGNLYIQPRPWPDPEVTADQ
jgi:hypothetical protein